MPKNVQMPDGSIVAFPDTMDDAAIHAEGLKYVQQQQQQQQAQQQSQQPAKPYGVSMMGPSNPGKIPDSVIDFLRPLLSGAAASGAAALSGPAAVATAPAAYIGTDALLQHLKEKKDRGITAGLAKLEPGGLPATLANTGEQFVLGKIGEKVIGAGGRALKALRNADQPEIMKLTPTTSQALESSGYSKLAKVTKAVEDVAVSNKNKALDRVAGNGFSEALDLAKRQDLAAFENPQEALGVIQKDMPPNFLDSAINPLKTKLVKGEPYQPLRKGQSFEPGTPDTTVLSGAQKKAGETVGNFAALDKVIADPAKLQSTLSRAAELGTDDNLRKSLAGYKFMDIFNKATTRKIGENVAQGNVTRIDPTVLAEEWLNPKMQDSLKLLYNANQRADISQFFKNLAVTQDKVGLGIGKKLWLMEGGVGLGLGFLTGHPVVGGAAGAAGLYLGAQGLSRLLTNPKTARLAVALAGGEPLGVSEQYAGKILTRALQGSATALINADGTKTPGTFEEGKFVPAQSLQ